MKIELVHYPENVENELIKMFLLCHQDSKIESTNSSAIKRMTKKLVRNNDSFFSNFTFIVRLVCSIKCYQQLKQYLLSIQWKTYFYDIKIPFGELTYTLPSKMNDKDRALFQSLAKKIDIMNAHFREKNSSLSDYFSYLPSSTNISFLMCMSFLDIYNVLSKIEQEPTDSELKHVVENTFGLLSDKSPNIFSKSIFEVFEANKEKVK